MLYIGPAGYPPGSKGPIQALERIGSLGLNALEAQFGRQAKMPEDKARAMGEKARELGIKLSAHAPYYINFNSKDRATVEKSIEWTLKTVRIAHHMGAWIVVMHAASYVGASPRETTEAVAANLRKCRAAMVEEGIDDVTLGLETMGKVSSWGTLEEIEQVMEEVDGIAPVIDFAHLHARGQGCLLSTADFRSAIEECRSAYKGHLHCHFSCIEFTEKGERRHLLLEERRPDFKMLVPNLRKLKCDVTIISETPQPTQDALQMKDLLS